MALSVTVPAPVAPAVGMSAQAAPMPSLPVPLWLKSYSSVRLVAGDVAIDQELKLLVVAVPSIISDSMMTAALAVVVVIEAAVAVDDAEGVVSNDPVATSKGPVPPGKPVVLTPEKATMAPFALVAAATKIKL